MSTTLEISKNGMSYKINDESTLRLQVVYFDDNPNEPEYSVMYDELDEHGQQIPGWSFNHPVGALCFFMSEIYTKSHANT